MSSTPAHPIPSEGPLPEITPVQSERSRTIVGVSSFALAALQSICTAVVAINGLRLAIGIGSLVMTTGAGAVVRHFHHTDWLRFSMLGLALLGAILNLGALWQIRRLRNRPAAQWRRMPLTSKQLRMERLQIFLSVATLAVIFVEEYLHFQLCHTI